MLIAGVDSDTNGSIAILDTVQCTFAVYKMPKHIKVLTSGQNRAELIIQNLGIFCVDICKFIDKVYIEEQWSRPNQSTPATFGFGRTYGEIRGCFATAFAANNKFDRVNCIHSSIWKHDLRLSSDKREAVELATKLFPECAHGWSKVKNTSAAEACLIALWALSNEGIRLKSGTNVVPSGQHYSSTDVMERLV